MVQEYLCPRLTPPHFGRCSSKDFCHMVVPLKLEDRTVWDRRRRECEPLDREVQSSRLTGGIRT